MAERWNLKRLTHWDVLVVAAICVAVVLLEPMLAGRARKGAERKQCAANLAQIGKAMFDYAADYEGALPRAGGPTTVWGPTHNWVARNRNAAFDLDAASNGGRASISSSFYLLVKYYDVPTRVFVCRGDEGTTEFNLEKLVGDVPSFTLARAWDFGPPGESCKHCSYSYHLPYSPFPLTTSRNPDLAVAADRNPYIKSPDNRARALASFKPDTDPYRGTAEQAREGNAVAHDLDGQNVLFLDQHVVFEKRPFCAVEKDNIYLVSPFPDRGCVIGWIPTLGGTGVTNERDSVLVHDPPMFGGATSVAMQHPAVTQKSAPPDKPHLHTVHAVGDSAVIDDFEGYSDNDRRIYEVWSDGLTNGNGSRTGYLQAPFAERILVHTGQQSMPMDYNNIERPWYSEIEASWRAPVNLPAYECDVLTLYAHGRADNGPVQFYVGIGDSAGRIATVAHPDPRLVNAAPWVAWRIPLRDFEQGGVDLTSATKIYLGVGDRKKPSRGGTGVVYIDDICLSKSSGAAGAGDVSK